MPRGSISKPRCECCDEVLQELLTMKQSIENLFHRFTNQIVELRREVRATLDDKKTSVSNTKTRSRSNSPLPKRKTKRKDSAVKVHNEDNDDEVDYETFESTCFYDESRSNEASSISIQSSPEKRRTTDVHAPSVAIIKKEPRPSTSANSRNRMKYSNFNFFGIHARVMPAQPFKKSDDFEAWDELLQSDEEQRDQLRIELLQGHFDDPEKFIKHIWKSLLTDNAAYSYSFRGNVKTNKKAIKTFFFTDLFKECFLQRYANSNGHFFMERTMRYFHYAQDRIRKIQRFSEVRRFENVEMEEPFDAQITNEPVEDLFKE